MLNPPPIESSSQKYLKLLQKVAIASNEANDFRELSTLILKYICETIEWPLGHLYMFESGKNELQSFRVWHSNSTADFSDFVFASEAISFAPGKGMPGYVFNRKTSLWIDDLQNDTIFIRKHASEKAGLLSAFAFPILVKDEVMGVVEIFSQEKVDADIELLEVSYHIGSQIGRVLERELNTLAISDRELTLSAILNNANDAIIIIDENGFIKDWNPMAEETFGYKKTEVLGQKLQDNILPPKYAQFHIAGMERMKNTGESKVLNKRLELSALHKSGREFPIELTISEVKAKNGSIFTAFLHDISDRKAEEQNLQNAKNKAETSEKAKETFLANMSHEIRTPLNSILGFNELLTKTTLSKDQEEYVLAVKQAGENLMMVINDILDISKIEAGKLALEETEINLRQLCESISLMLLPKAKEKKINLQFKIDEKVPSVVIGDKVRLNQILLNLLSNALKFTYEGEVTVEIKARDFENGKCKVVFKVQDNGIGVPEEKLADIFDSFSQASSGTARLYGGTGLGLAIVKQLVGLQGGEVSVTSSEGVGSLFEFTLSYTLPTEKRKESGKVRALKENFPLFNTLAGLRILVVEDNKMNQKLACKVIERWGISAVVAENGKKAVELLAQDSSFDLILMDLMMPEMDGYEATKHIIEQMKIEIPIVAMTAHAIKGEKEKCLSSGMKDYISKPFNQDDLFKKIDQYALKSRN